MVESQDIVNVLPPEKQKEILDMFSKTISEQNTKLEDMKKEHIEQLKALKTQYDSDIAQRDREIKKRDRALETMLTTGINLDRIDGLEIIAPYLSSSAERMQLMLETNPPEYVKFVMNQYIVLTDEKMQRLEDMNLNINGESIGIELAKVAKFFDEHPTTADFKKPEDITMYANRVQEFLQAYYDLNEWKKVQADIGNINEMSAQAIFHYAIEQMKINLKNAKEGEKVNEVAINPVEKLEQIKAQKEAEMQKPIIEEQIKQQEIQFKEETKQKLGIIEQGIAAIKEAISPESEKSSVPVEIDPEPLDEAKPRGRKKAI